MKMKKKLFCVHPLRIVARRYNKSSISKNVRFALHQFLFLSQTNKCMHMPQISKGLLYISHRIGSKTTQLNIAILNATISVRCMTF